MGVFQKEFNTDILPSLGMKIMDGAFVAFEGKPRDIKEIIIDYEKDECVITLIPQKFYKDEDLKAYKPMYESNGWKWSG